MNEEVNAIGKRILCILFVLAIIASCVLPGQAQAATAEKNAGVVSITTGYLNVRRSASTSAGVVSTLKKGSYVTLLSKEGSWWRVEYAPGRYGYCHGSYIRAVDASSATVSTAGSPLNVRSGAGTSYSRIGSLSNGASVLVLSTTGNWHRVLYGGAKTGYVSASYIKLGSDYRAISLSVPYYLQTDSRWSWVTLGPSGQTMGKIGCTTTALAMAESYRQGKTIYPDAMAKKLSYTSSGSLYWPSNYVGVTSGLDLKAIYEYLKQGKPVIVGFTNRNGGQHWAVIYGYSGGNSLKTGGFLIRDPGSKSRTNLSQLIEDYPNFSKYVYYK
ncbi:MAG: hypothetical protein E7453_05255 [Ruminococcaceae bacterium]|nr:hypothetical protein [Oscillospiraceae bacterium]